MADRQKALHRKLRLPLALTWAGLLAERLSRAFWPLWSLLLAASAALMMGWQDVLAVELVWGIGAFALLMAGWLTWRGLRRFALPERSDALARLDETMPGRPISAALDNQAIGAGDDASRAVWAAHQARMTERAAGAKAPKPDLRIARLDPFALRYVAAVMAAVALLFGSFDRIGSVAGMGPGAAQAAAPAWEGWIAPPAHTGLPVLYMADLAPEQTIQVPAGSQITLRLYGPPGMLTLAETVSGRVGELPPASAPAQDFTVAKGGEVEILGPGGRSWSIALLPDRVPTVELLAGLEVDVDGQMSMPFAAQDDYGVVSGRAFFELDLAAIDRRHGLMTQPEPRPAIEMPLPLPIAGSRAQFEEILIENFSQHPWANLPVRVSLFVQDEAGQEGAMSPQSMPLPARRFFDPVAGSLIEQRRDLLWSRQNAPRIARLLRTLAHRPQERLFDKPGMRDTLMGIIEGLEQAHSAPGGLSEEDREKAAQALWDLAISIEEGDLEDARARMREAQERLEEAMKNGASKEEIARLMQELRDATQDYMRMLAQENQRDSEENQEFSQGDNTMQMDQSDLQRMMDRIQELMEQGRMAEAMEALRELQEMMENMRVAEGQGGGPSSPGQQALEGLGETLRDQQELSDESFRDLQEQFNPRFGEDSQQGQQNQPGQPGQQGQQGQGAQPQGDGQGQQGQQGQGGADAQSLADRQQQLRRELQRQQGRLPQDGSEAGRAARDALGRAGRAMEEAEESLRQNDLAGAIDRQAEAMDALRDGIRNLGEALARDGERSQGGESQQAGRSGTQQDPLGRPSGQGTMSDGSDGTAIPEEQRLQAQRLLDEIRRRSFDRERSELELDYLKRLLDRF